jgi:hypothetical protein
MQKYGWARDRVITQGSERSPTEQDGYMAKIVAAGLATEEVQFAHHDRNKNFVYRFTDRGLALLKQYTENKS